jgi:hypothetical protein
MAQQITWPDSIEPYIISTFLAFSIRSPDDVLPHDEFSLSKLTGLSITTCRNARRAVVDMMSVRGETFSDLSKKRMTLSTGIPSLDSALGGGICLGWLTEIHGEAGSGKTQFCLTVTANALLLGHDVFWIDADGSFRPDRLAEIMKDKSASLDKLAVARCFTVTEFIISIDSVTVFCENSKRPPLVIVDSIASILKGANKSRVEDIAQKLRSIKCFIICTNHVVADFAALPGEQTFKPALGSTWSHLVSVTLSIKRLDIDTNERVISVSKSPTCGSIMLLLRILREGLQ